MKKKLLSILFALGIVGTFLTGTNMVFGTALPLAPAIFQTSLSSPISSSATSLTLTANLLRGGSTVSGYTCVTIDEGSAQAEFVCGTLSGTSMTGLTRGINPLNGTSTVTALQFAHRRGAVVKITDFPVLTILRNQSNGTETFPNVLKYDITITDAQVSAATNTLATVSLLNSLVISGAPNGSEVVKGIWEGATALETASSTVTGATAAGLVVQSRYATDTPTTGCAVGYTATVGSGCVPVARLDGKISPNFIATSSAYAYNWGGLQTHTATTVLATTTINGKDATPKFGGDGRDGVLNITSGTTTIDVGAQKYFVKNYSSINISVGAALAFSNPNTTGTIVVLKSGSTTIGGRIDLAGVGAAANQNGVGQIRLTSLLSAGAAFSYNNTIYGKFIDAVPGAGSQSSGIGGGALIFEISGAYNFPSTGIISSVGGTGAAGAAASAFVACTAGYGGAAGGSLTVMYASSSLIANLGQYITTGGVGGAGGAGSDAGSGGGPGVGGAGGSSHQAVGGAGGAGKAAGGGAGTAGSTGGGSNGGAGGAGGAAGTFWGACGGGGGGSGGYSVVVPNTEFN